MLPLWLVGNQKFECSRPFIYQDLTLSPWLWACGFLRTTGLFQSPTFGFWWETVCSHYIVYYQLHVRFSWTWWKGLSTVLLNANTVHGPFLIGSNGCTLLVFGTVLLPLKLLSLLTIELVILYKQEESTHVWKKALESKSQFPQN